MKIDVRDSLLIITDRKRFFKEEQGYALRYSLQRHVPYIKVSPFERYHERVLFDTGSRQLYAMNNQHFDRGEKACSKQNRCRQSPLTTPALSPVLPILKLCLIPQLLKIR